jgi:hypothetical protein
MKLLISFFLCISICKAQQKLPVVFVHGFLASGDTWSKQYHRFLLNGYTPDQLQVFDWNTLNSKGSDSLLELFIDHVLKLNHTSQLNLVTHSAGGGLGYAYCAKPEHTGKIAHYIHIASSRLTKPAGVNAEIPTAIIYSTDDAVVRNAGNTEGATNFKLTGLDHYEAATSDSSFIKIYTFLNGIHPKPLQEDDKTEKQVFIRNLYFATNHPIPKSKATVRQFDAEKGRFTGKEKTFTSNEEGIWQMKVKGNDRLQYSFSIQPGVTERKVVYFFDPIRTNKLIRLRAFNAGNMIGMLLSQLPNTENQPALCIFSSNKAIIAGRDTLSVNETPISGPGLTPAAKTIIAAFIYDDGDAKSSGKKHPLFANAPFMIGVDCFIDAKKHKTIRISYNGRNTIIPLIASKEAITVVVLD